MHIRGSEFTLTLNSRYQIPPPLSLFNMLKGKSQLYLQSLVADTPGPYSSIREGCFFFSYPAYCLDGMDTSYWLSSSVIFSLAPHDCTGLLHSKQVASQFSA